ncbi:MAG: O-antigen ligase family protein [Blastocatellia bacterium]|nr:O-antigen ligase family protein [Blastocatellia bacterium]
MNDAIASRMRRNRATGFSGNIVQFITQSSGFQAVLFLIAHLFLAILMSQASIVATAHALATLGIGFWLAATTRQPERIAYVVAYITGSEVLWRMTQAQVFWEFGKYAIVLILLVSIIRSGHLRGFALPFIYFALLLPSTILPMENTTTDELRGHLSFNLSGPLALTLCVWYFSQCRYPKTVFYPVFLMLVAPIAGIGAVTLLGTFRASVLKFGNESNYVTSGGFGPNQVSSILGLGVLATFLYLLTERKNRLIKPILFVLMMGMAAQSAMTFSRTGLYNAATAAAAALFYLVRDGRARMKLLGMLLVGFLVVNFVLLPKLDEFTSGTLLKRFQSTSLTGRDTIIRADLSIWSDHPVFGVGPGRANPYRATMYRESAAHTEFSRMVAEHGVFGFLAFVLLLYMCYRNLRRSQTPQAKAIAVGLTCWSFGFMLVTAMRLVAPCAILGLGSAFLFPDDEERK